MTGRATIIENGLSRVPPFPPIAVRLLAMLADSSVEVNDVAKLISSDATFTARLLQCVNSYEFGLLTPVANVQQAVALVGLIRTRDVVLACATGIYAKAALRTAGLRRCWQHSIATAVLADEIAKSCKAFTEIAFTAGIMHDIGRLGLLVAYPAEYEEIVRTAGEKCVDLLDFEREQFGMDHAEAGRILAERWRLPEELRVVAGRHHDPLGGEELDLLRVVRVACRLADALGYEVTRPVVQVDFETLLWELPPLARARMIRTPAELCSRIEKGILEFDSDRDAGEAAGAEASVGEIAAEPVTAVEVATAGDPRRRAILPGILVTVSILILITVLIFWRIP